MKDWMAKGLALALAGTGFLRLIYPELMMNEQTYQVTEAPGCIAADQQATGRVAANDQKAGRVAADARKSGGNIARDPEKDFQAILNGEGRIVIRSRLAEWIEEKAEKRQSG